MKSIFVAIIVVGMMAGSCTREQVSVKANNDFHVENTNNQTFTIVEQANQQTLLLDETAIREEVEKQMEIRGYVARNKDADVLISIAVYDKNQQITEGGGVEGEEDINVLELDFKDALNKIKTGEIRDAKTIMLLQYAQINNLITY